MAINRADTQYIAKRYYDFASVHNATENCIFISHKSEDKEAAQIIGEYIIKSAGIDIYLDIKDTGLQGALKRNDDKEIVKCIEQGILKSSHVLCLISDKTQISWWVPYEIGYGKNDNKNIASLKLKKALELPSFLKIEEEVLGLKSFNEYLSKINKENHLISWYSSDHPVKDIVDTYK